MDGMDIFDVGLDHNEDLFQYIVFCMIIIAIPLHYLRRRLDLIQNDTMWTISRRRHG